MIVIGAIAASCGVPPLAIALTALTAGGITVWSVATDPVLHGDEPSSPGAQ